MSISRAEVIARAQTLWGGLQTTEYSQDDYRNGWRTDCSGFVSGCWDLPSTDYNTVSLVTSGVMFEISLNDLQPGDACGNCGPGTEGDNGHVVLFDKWVSTDPNNNDYWIYEQAGGGAGPLHRAVTWPYPGESNWKAYRFTGITDGGDDMALGDVYEQKLREFLDGINNPGNVTRRGLLELRDGVDPAPNPGTTAQTYYGLKQAGADLAAIKAAVAGGSALSDADRALLQQFTTAVDKFLAVLKTS